jgi:hypothetical protein
LWAAWFASSLPLRPMLTKTLWVVPLLIQVAIAAIMLRRKLAGVFPVFFGYTVVVASREIVLHFLPYSGRSYSLVYWWTEALAVLLGLGVVFETLRNILPPYPFLRVILKWVWVLGGIAAATALLMLVFSTGSTPAQGPTGGPAARADGAVHDTKEPPKKKDPVLDSILLLERAGRFLQVCLLIVVIALMSRLGLTWQQYSVGIVAGFGIFSALDLAVLELRGHLHFVSEDTFVLIHSAAYNLGAVIWAAYFLRSWSRTPIAYLPKTNLPEWNEAVTDYVDQCYRRS